MLALLGLALSMPEWSHRSTFQQERKLSSTCAYQILQCAQASQLHALICLHLSSDTVLISLAWATHACHPSGTSKLRQHTLAVSKGAHLSAHEA